MNEPAKEEHKRQRKLLFILTLGSGLFITSPLWLLIDNLVFLFPIQAMIGVCLFKLAIGT